MKKKYYYIYLIIILDLISKYLIKKNFYLHEKKIIFSFLNIFYTNNYGVAFSLLPYNNIWKTCLLYIVNTITIVSIIIILQMIDKKNKTKIIAFLFILSGAIGNFIDRILNGFVTDFIDIHISTYHFATFNISDSSIFIGVNIMILTHIYNSYKIKSKDFI